MKRRVTLILTAVVLLGVGIAVAVGSGSADPMISKSYWENTYLPGLAEALQQKANEDTKSTYSAVADKLAKAAEADVKAAGEKGGGFTQVQLKAGDMLELKKGASAVVQSGSAALGTGVLADVTEGAEAFAGEGLAASHRYVVTSDSATLRQTQAGSVAYLGSGTVKAGSGGDTTVPGKALPFVDVTGDQWFHAAVAFVYEKGYFSGTSATTFDPNASMDRAMVATVLHRVAGGESFSATETFADVPADQWYSKGIAWASAKGIVNGMGGNRYEPTTAVTREQLVTMLYRFEKDYRKVAVPATGSLSNFADGAKVSSWAQDAMGWAIGAGLIQGRNTGLLDPTGTATRAEVATILQRFAGRL